jgi:hypothetical protein
VVPQTTMHDHMEFLEAILITQNIFGFLAEHFESSAQSAVISKT